MISIESELQLKEMNRHTEVNDVTLITHWSYDLGHVWAVTLETKEGDVIQGFDFISINDAIDYIYIKFTTWIEKGE